MYKKKVREKSSECHNHKPQPFPDPKRKRKPTNLNKHKPNKRTKSTKISSLFLEMLLQLYNNICFADKSFTKKRTTLKVKNLLPAGEN